MILFQKQTPLVFLFNIDCKAYLSNTGKSKIIKMPLTYKSSSSSSSSSSNHADSTDFPLFSLPIHLFYPSLLGGLTSNIQYSHSVDLNVLPGHPTLASLWVVIHWKKHPLWVRPRFNDSVLYVLSILLGWFLRRKVSGRTSVVFWGIVCRICLKLFVAFLCRDHPAFFHAFC